MLPSCKLSERMAQTREAQQLPSARVLGFNGGALSTYTGRDADYLVLLSESALKYKVPSSSKFFPFKSIARISQTGEMSRFLSL